MAQPVEERRWRRCECGKAIAKIAHDRIDGHQGVLLLGDHPVLFHDRIVMACHKCGKEHTIRLDQQAIGPLMLRASG